MVVEARRGPAPIETDRPASEIAAIVATGTIVIVKGAFDPAELRLVRERLLAWQAPDHDQFQLRVPWSTRHRGEDPPELKTRHVFQSYRLVVDDPLDEIGPAVRAPFERLADYWRALTGGSHGFAPGADGKAVRAWVMYYPCGGGHFGWHEHPLEPQRIGLIASMAEYGVDYRLGTTEFRTPHGVVDVTAVHDIGDVCLFRYDLPHRVSPVDPHLARRWDGPGRWSLVIPIQ
jgi:hypothetical protein